MGVVVVTTDNEYSVDDIVYNLSAGALKFFGDYDQKFSTKAFCQSFTTNFVTPAKLLECSKTEKKDIMSEHLEESEEQKANNARGFMRHMDSQSWSCADAFPAVLGLVDQSLTLLDVGGGSAIYTIAAAKANPNLRGNVYELANIKPITEEYIAASGLSDRIQVTAGDFFSDAPFPAADIVLFANIFHDWADQTNITLINKTFSCLNPGGRIVISELLLGDDVSSSSSASTSMNVIMIPWTKGRQYRPKELFRRLTDAGFVRPRVLKLVDDYSVVIAEKQ